LISLIAPLILCFTVIGSVALGIVTTYASVVGILHAFGRASQPEVARQRPRLVLVTSQSQVGGD
jgi:TRAP-type mannitol/chloroaromatic compound transport system permease large subunit